MLNSKKVIKLELLSQQSVFSICKNVEILSLNMIWDNYYFFIIK